MIFIKDKRGRIYTKDKSGMVRKLTLDELKDYMNATNQDSEDSLSLTTSNKPYVDVTDSADRIKKLRLQGDN